MSERIGNSYRILVGAGAALAAFAMLGALYLLAKGEILDGTVLGVVTWFLFRWFWSATLRNRNLLRHGWSAGRRNGANWEYEELRDGEVVFIELPLDYVGRGEYEIHVPGERAWAATMPQWASERRTEIVERLQTVFKRSQVLFDPDSSPGERVETSRR